ncbi:hypothetical protein [Pseudonocardia acaciae]|uniref:hypothetical protein n=1 Tax=Pseudonocardia acaciae TaxID=551276 RepID=UPI000688387C|nr:hypothetical protein [Pseudonocardia acaciae]
MDVTHHRRRPWRSSGGSLARPSDRIEALILAVLFAAGFAVVGIGIWAGHATADGLARHGPRVQAAEYAAQAVATGDARSFAGAGPNGVVPWSVPVAWSTPSGPASGSVLVDHAVAAGAPVPVVVDRAGRPRAAQPPRLSGAPVVVGVVTVLAGWLLLASLWLLTNSGMACLHAAGLDAEWERVEPMWSGRSE